MRLFRHHAPLPADATGAVLALGNFDGVHRGHQTVIAAAGAIARSLGAPHGVLTFEPHPRQVFRPDDAPFRLTPLRVKAREIEALGADLLFSLHFDKEFAQRTAENFVEEILAGALAVRHVVVGYDFVFGRGRAGTVAFLKDMGARHGFGVDVVAAVAEDGAEVISSTRIREHLVAGRPTDAARLLGRAWEIDGRVEHGDARGRTIGFPTANVMLADYLRPAAGVYAVRVGIERDAAAEWIDGVANIGMRPTVGGTDLRLEAHLLDFSGDLYGSQIRVALIDFIRPERKFASFDELKQQIAADALEARALHGRTPSAGR
ncbi:MAG TPA: bifunctional riboflavin kinase/FAD synthetase [Aliidongia sp.]|uniref:bifunctional riboflavin kinase/FAD synthetase n=1 Tax=Aliidongia sp. TaxID=1914230 RepID=UPI002DDDB23B|nr:bifunctional riboflavin kinase/FAD synthetase [Aliidongia sp.]HEV2677213.1 bifunctional riboflavin kinase/FAD synthetase [Aliidongia sp.]